MHVTTKSLPAAVQSALKSVDYHVADVEIVAAETVELSSYAGKGSRGFAVLVDLATGARQSMHGSWGGSNMFTQTAVDDSTGSAQLPPSGILIKGSQGYPRTFARIYVNPAVMPRILPAAVGDEGTSDEDQAALYCYVAIKGGEYRRDELRRRNVSQSTVDGLVERGLLKRNKAGATAVTTDGKNSLDRSRVKNAW